MARLARDIRTSVKAGASIMATVTDTHFGRASVRLLQNGQQLHNLFVVGGPVVIGQQVRVDFTTATPTIIVTGQEGITTDDVQTIVDQTAPPPYILPPAPSIMTIAIYHNGTFVADVEGINFVDGT